MQTPKISNFRPSNAAPCKVLPGAATLPSRRHRINSDKVVRG